MTVASELPFTFSDKKPEEKTIADIEKYLSTTMSNFAVLELMKKAIETVPWPYLISAEMLQEASIVTSNEWADALVDRRLCLGTAPARNCVRKELGSE